MAKQLYDYWFVQFDFPNEEGKPYKSSGGAMVWNEKLKREIPTSFDVKSLSEIIEVKDGTHDSPKPQDNGYFLLTSKHLTERGLDYTSAYKISKEDYESINKRSKVDTNDILFSMIGTIGNSYFVEETNINFAIKNMALFKTSAKRWFSEYLYLYLSSCDYKHYEGNSLSGSIQKFVSLRTLRDMPILYHEDIIKVFAKEVRNIITMMVNLRKENIELTKQRDELLPLLMNGQASVNYHLSASFLSSLILYRDQYKFYDMKETIIQTVLDGMRAVLTENQLDMLTDVTRKALSECEITPKATEEEQRNKENVELLGTFISSKKVEGCSDKTIHYYKSSIEKLIATVKKNVCDIATNDIRCYLAEQQEQRGLSKVTIDNLRRIYSSFFSWLEDEDYITKSPVRRIHKVRTDALVKEVLTDENIEVLRDSCQELRDIAMIDLLLSTGMRVGELVKINREDIDFQERQCIVFGKGNKEREVYFNARTKIHLKKYLEQRTDTNPALFVSLHEPHTRLTISGVEVRLRQLGKRVNLNKVHPHKFRRTLATMAIDKGMPIEQVQKMLGHVKIDTTLHYAMVNQTNVKIAHRKFLN